VGMWALRLPVARAAPLARTFSIESPKLRIGAKIGVGIRYKLPKTAQRYKAPELAEEGDMTEHFKYWRGITPEISKYSDEDLKAYRKEFREHAALDKIQLSAFQRFVKQKCKKAKINAALLPTVTYELWADFDQDVGNFVDFGEFVTHYPAMCRSILRRIFQSDGDAIFEKHAKDGKLTAEALGGVIQEYGLHPCTGPDVQVILDGMAGHENATETCRDGAAAWSGDFSSTTTRTLFSEFE